MRAPRGASTIIGGDGNNAVTLDGWGNSVRLGSGDNTVTGGAGNANISVGGGANRIILAGWGNSVTASGGTDTVLAGAGTDRISLIDGRMTIVGGAHATILASGTDVITDQSYGLAVQLGPDAQAITFTGLGSDPGWMLDLVGQTTSLSNILATLHTTGDGAQFTLASGATVTFSGLPIGTITPDHFRVG